MLSFHEFCSQECHAADWPSLSTIISVPLRLEALVARFWPWHFSTLKKLSDHPTSTPSPSSQDKDFQLSTRNGGCPVGTLQR